jgi:mannose-6-phosphate isomerase-like protein (cupin superfamily)
MKTRLLAPLAVAVIATAPLAGQGPASLADRIAHTDPAQFQQRASVHQGAGPMAYMGLFNSSTFQTNLNFLHRGVIPPGGGIGHHFHNASEEIFLIFNGEAEFTINGRTSRLRGPVGVPVVMGNSHAIYNPTNENLQWMNISVSALKGEAGAFDLDDPRVGVELDPIPVFMTMPLERERLRPVQNMHGGQGTVQYRRALQPTVFRTPWAYVDHMLVEPGASIGAHRHRAVTEFYYVMAGSGTVAISTGGGGGEGGWETAPIRMGDAIPIHLNESHSFENTGNQPLEFLVVGVARDMTKNLETSDVNGQR